MFIVGGGKDLLLGKKNREKKNNNNECEHCIFKPKQILLFWLKNCNNIIVCDKKKNMMGWRTRADKLLDTYNCLAL